MGIGYTDVCTSGNIFQLKRHVMIFDGANKIFEIYLHHRKTYSLPYRPTSRFVCRTVLNRLV